MTAEELEKVLKNHLHWINEDCEGWENMGADLRSANLRSANLMGANLMGANLRGADLRSADLMDADLRGANLRSANLRGADLRGANLMDADLRGANLMDADLRGADLRGAKGVVLGFACPDEGAFVAWKKAKSDDRENAVCIVKLKIPDDARRLSATTNKCRADKAQVIGIETIDGTPLPDDFIAHSSHDPDFTYKLGDKLEIKDFDENRWNECSTGIHFFINRIDAVNY